MNTQPVLQACFELINEGKSPSIALIKRKLSVPLPLSIIVKGKTQFVENQESIMLEFKENQHSQPIAEKQPLGASLQETEQSCKACDQLLYEVSQLRDELKALQAEVQALKRQ